MRGISIIKTSSYLPPKIVTNADLAKIVDIDDEWVVSRSGIKERRFAEHESNANMAAAVARDLIDGQDTADICAILVATFTPDHFTPSVACVVQKAVGLPVDIMALDFNCACSGFLYGLNLARGILLQQPDKKVILIGSEKISPHLNFEDKGTCVLFGDGAGGVLLELKEGDNPFTFGTDGNDVVIRCGKEAEDKIEMQGRDVFTFAVNVTASSIQTVLEKAGCTIDDVAHIVCHQANFRIISRVQKKLGYPMEKFFVNLEKYGNTSGASIPIALDEMNRSGQLKKQDKIILVGFGAGLTWGATMIVW